MSSRLWTVEIPLPLVMAIVIAMLYVVRVLHYYQAMAPARELLLQSQRELRRARSVISELEQVIGAACKNLANHQAHLGKLKHRIGWQDKKQQETAWDDLCREVKEILDPTLRLAAQVADASEQIRHQTGHLMTFTEMRTDPLTKVGNRAGLGHALIMQLAEMVRYGTEFSVTLFDIDHFKQINDRQGHLQGDRALQEVATLVYRTVREVDIVARYGGDEFVVIMPHTNLKGACVFSERMRAKIEKQLSITVSGGVTAAVNGDTPESLLSRADAVMYSAKHAGRNRVFSHNGETIEAVAEDADPSGANLEATTSREARPSDIAGTVNQATEAVESEDLQPVMAGPADLHGQAAE